MLDVCYLLLNVNYLYSHKEIWYWIKYIWQAWLFINGTIAWNILYLKILHTKSCARRRCPAAADLSSPALRALNIICYRHSGWRQIKTSCQDGHWHRQAPWWVQNSSQTRRHPLLCPGRDGIDKHHVPVLIGSFLGCLPVLFEEESARFNLGQEIGEYHGYADTQYLQLCLHR